MKTLILALFIALSIGAAEAGYQAPAQNYQQNSWMNG